MHFDIRSGRCRLSASECIFSLDWFTYFSCKLVSTISPQIRNIILKSLGLDYSIRTASSPIFSYLDCATLLSACPVDTSERALLGGAAVMLATWKQEFGLELSYSR